MATETLYLANLAEEVAIQKDGIVSRTLQSDEVSKTVLFGFDTGQELSEHTASVPAMLQFLSGEGTVTLGDRSERIRPGTWAYMPAQLPHSIKAETPLVMLLVMFKSQQK